MTVYFFTVYILSQWGVKIKVNNVLWCGTEFSTRTVLTLTVEWLLAVANCHADASVTIFPTSIEF